MKLEVMDGLTQPVMLHGRPLWPDGLCYRIADEVHDPVEWVVGEVVEHIELLRMDLEDMLWWT